MKWLFFLMELVTKFPNDWKIEYIFFNYIIFNWAFEGWIQWLNFKKLLMQFISYCLMSCVFLFKLLSTHFNEIRINWLVFPHYWSIGPQQSFDNLIMVFFYFNLVSVEFECAVNLPISPPFLKPILGIVQSSFS